MTGETGGNGSRVGYGGGEAWAGPRYTVTFCNYSK
jgi:hypothetical protein